MVCKFLNYIPGPHGFFSFTIIYILNNTFKFYILRIQLRFIYIFITFVVYVCLDMVKVKPGWVLFPFFHYVGPGD